MGTDDLKFAHDAKSAVESNTVRGAWTLLFFVILGLVALVGWASWAKVEQVTKGTGRVIPSQQLQIIESLEPGIIREILVAEGDQVEEGQKLLRIDDTAARSRLGEIKQKQLAFSAELHRLRLQASEAEEFKLPESVSRQQLPFYLDQKAVFENELRQLKERLSILRSQRAQKEQLLVEANTNAEKQVEALSFAERELELTRRLFSRKAVPELEFLQIQRLVNNLRGELRIMETSKIRINEEVQEAKKKIEAEQSAFSGIARERISKVNAELSVVAESLKAAEDRVRRADFTSPVSGIVNTVNVATIGEVVQSGSTLIEIVPLDDTLLIEAKIRPEDIAFIRPGLKATIRLTAYDYTKFGTLSGTVERIGADTVTDENNETFYQVVVATDPGIADNGKIKILPGMVADVDISTGERTILEYLSKPVLRIKDRAFHDPN